MTAVADTSADPSASTVAYSVLGMSCGHCSAAVTEALTALPGVSAVEIDLPGKRAVVTSAAPLEVAVVRDVIEDAGYQLV
ncbi:heavy-metal-associated domain-containing protein [Catenulispora pinisilvae]|uniref:heavy-metal-associated domain-containing protein n=1 Tax=Catenulispora pinisilvae TaxID=2705253 RepID=UPI001890E2BA|nr:heavy metal-associated domain-containing protein [Catenulispora pinisilvae]